MKYGWHRKGDFEHTVLVAVTKHACVPPIGISLLGRRGGSFALITHYRAITSIYLFCSCGWFFSMDASEHKNEDLFLLHNNNNSCNSYTVRSYRLYTALLLLLIKRTTLDSIICIT
jgi:hypothetical protein